MFILSVSLRISMQIDILYNEVDSTSSAFQKRSLSSQTRSKAEVSRFVTASGPLVFKARARELVHASSLKIVEENLIDRRIPPTLCFHLFKED